jgi:hypothetical protein
MRCAPQHVDNIKMNLGRNNTTYFLFGIVDNTRFSKHDLEEEEIMDATGNDGNASMPEQVKRPNPGGR